jgi:ABC-type multidrug transport system fused ATPase/permease subunit
MEAIKFEHVSFAYDNGFVAVDDISLTIEAGEKSCDHRSKRCRKDDDR